MVKVVEASQTSCPTCGSLNVTMGACAIGSITVHNGNYSKAPVDEARFRVVSNWTVCSTAHSATTRIRSLEMMSKFDRIFETSMFISLAVLAIMANTQCPTWLRIAL
ncbi:hypothetical protein X980_6054 [Burkholderia pseudomallei MSHR4000]|nr:hypothetical protein X980_6054 [Burkholderia pseudomallei MSHR4000]